VTLPFVDNIGLARLWDPCRVAVHGCLAQARVKQASKVLSEEQALQKILAVCDEGFAPHIY
jgi:hypothetical protein